jgi:hypothetical protein
MDRRQSLKWLSGISAFVLPVAAPGPAWAGDSGSKLQKSKAEWATLLPQPAYRVLFEEDTERAGSSPLNQEKRDGTFVCAACHLPLFDSSTKYDSGTGWPSFWQHLPERSPLDRLQADLSAYRVPLQPLRRAPGPCLQRRPQTDRQALLQQRRGPAVRAASSRSCRNCGHEDTPVRCWAAAARDRRRRCSRPGPARTEVQDSDFRRRLLLVHRGGFREAAGSSCRRIRLYRRQYGQPKLRAGQRRQHRSHRGHPRQLRSAERSAIRNCSTTSGGHRSDGQEPAILRHRHAVPQRHLLAERGERQAAESSRDALLASGKLAHIETEIAAASTFYPAEEYHQDYYKKNSVRYAYYRLGVAAMRG